MSQRLQSSIKQTVYIANRRRLILASAVAIPAISILAQAPAQAADQYWDGDGVGPVDGASGQWDATSNRWGDTASSTTLSPFNPASDAIFGGTGGVVHVSGSLTANSLTINSPGYTFINPATSASTLTLTSGVINTNGNFVQTLPALAGTSGLTKNGTGTLVFDGLNTYTGATTINAGTLALGNTATADIPGLSAVTVGSAGTLDLNLFGGWYVDAFGSLAGSGLVKLGTSTAGFGSTTGSTMTAGADGTSTTFSGVISGAGGRVTKLGGTGTLTLSGVNTYGGPTTIGSTSTTTGNGGTLRLEGGAAIADSSAVFLINGFAAGGNSTLELGAHETVGSIGSASAPGIIINANGFDLTIGGDNLYNAQYNAAIIGTGSRLIKIGTGIQQMATGGTASTYSGGTVIKGGILLTSSDTKMGAAGAAITLDGGTLSNFANGTTGTSLTHARDITVTANNGTIQVINQDGTQRVTTLSNKVTGPGTLTKAGPGTVTFGSAANDWTGGLVVHEGIAFSTVQTGTPFGTGSVTLNRGRLNWSPGGTSASVATTVASNPGGTFSYGAGAELQVNKGTNTTLTLTIGDAAASSSTLNRLANGTLTIIPGGNIANLGTAAGDRIVVNGGVPVTNGIVSPSIVSQTQVSGTTGDYLTYDATDGFKIATYNTQANINGDAGAPYAATDNTTVYKAPAAQTLDAPRSVYALNTAFAIDGAHALTIGNGSGPAGAILNVGGALNTGSVVFDGSEAVIYTMNTAVGNVAGPLSITGSGGLTKFGIGSLTLNAPASYAGPTTVAGGVLAVNGTDLLPTTTNLVFSGMTAGTQAQLKLNGNSQTVASLASENTYARIDLGGGTLTVNQNTDTSFRGTLISAGTLVKSGSGTLTMNPQNGSVLNQAAGSPFQSLYTKLKISGGTVSMSSVHSMPTAPAGATPDVFTLENGGTLQWTNYATALNTLGTSSSLSVNRGVTLGAGGGVIDVAHPLEILLWQFSNTELPADARSVFSGSGDLTKAGAGTFRLGIGNTNSGSVIVKQGTLQFQTESALGALTGFREDGLTLDGGMAQSNGTGVLSTNRGIKVTDNDGTVSGALTFNAPIIGTGDLTKVSASALVLNAASPGYSGNLILTNGRTDFSTSGSAGTGTIKVNPLFPVIFSKNTGASATVLNNEVELGAGATIDIRVDSDVPSLTLAGKVTGPASFYKSRGGSTLAPAGLGTLVLSNSTNDFAGNTVVQTGTLVAAANNALGSTAGATIVNPGASLAFDGGINYSTAETVYAVGTGAAASGAIKNISGDNTFAGPVRLTGDATIDVSAGTLNLSAGIGGAGHLTKSGANALTTKNVRTGGLTVSSGTLNITPDGNEPGMSIVKSLTISSAVLNLNDNDIIIDYAAGDPSPEFTIRDYVKAFYLDANATSGISYTRGTGDRVIAVAEKSEWGKTELNGVAIDNTTIVGKYTYFGDANLDGKVDSNDYVAVDVGLGVGDSWVQGDFNFSGTVTSDDYVAIDTNLGKGITVGDPLAIAELKAEMIALHTAQFGDEYVQAMARVEEFGMAALVPEPGALGLLGIGAAGLLGRRRRRA